MQLLTVKDDEYYQERISLCRSTSPRLKMPLNSSIFSSNRSIMRPRAVLYKNFLLSLRQAAVAFENLGCHMIRSRVIEERAFSTHALSKRTSELKAYHRVGVNCKN